LILFSSSSLAQSLSPFKAEFEVEALGMVLGKAKHAMDCQQNHCTLTSDAKPSGLAAMLSSDASFEEVTLVQNGAELKWLKYKKTEHTKKNGEPRTKIKTLTLNETNNTIVYQKNKRQWPAKANTYDSISLAYAIQHAELNEKKVDNFVLQDTHFQAPLKLKSRTDNSSVELNFADYKLDAVKYQFTSSHAQVDIWLLPKYNFFPGKIKILNKKKQTIQLTLAEPPKNR
jgi:hypothetical protein